MMEEVMKVELMFVMSITMMMELARMVTMMATVVIVMMRAYPTVEEEEEGL